MEAFVSTKKFKFQINNSYFLKLTKYLFLKFFKTPDFDRRIKNNDFKNCIYCTERIKPIYLRLFKSIESTKFNIKTLIYSF